jgi:hypothetical protein
VSRPKAPDPAFTQISFEPIWVIPRTEEDLQTIPASQPQVKHHAYLVEITTIYPNQLEADLGK